MRERRINEVKGVILVAVGLMILASLIRFDRLDLVFFTSHPNFPTKNLLGVFGAYLGGILILLFGNISSFIIPLLAIRLGIKYFHKDKPYISIARVIGVFAILVSLSSLIGMFNLNNDPLRFQTSGFFGALISSNLTKTVAPLGAFIIFTLFLILGWAFFNEELISSLFSKFIGKLKSFFAWLPFFSNKQKAAKVKTNLINKGSLFSKKQDPQPVNSKPKIFMPLGVSPKLKIQIKDKAQAEPIKLKPSELKIGDYHLPSVDLLDAPPPADTRQMKEDLEACARTLEDTLEDFGISAKVTDIIRGPVITRYELEPAAGVKINRIEALSDDIALAIKAQSIRIIAPIPGKGRVGVEVPNLQSTLVCIRDLLTSAEYSKQKSPLTIALGKDITGRSVFGDLDDMPHLLIAGTTGSGKTVCVNTCILSLLFRGSPNNLKFLMIDPKMVELMPFNGLPHLLCPVVTDAKKAAVALNWVVSEMESRYVLLSKAGVRNIEAYNEKQEKIPYIIVIVDEFADLMSVARDQIENAITRLAQLSRAVGIHLILATQRPSVDVITGVIKANLPARVSFKVASKVDSRTVLDSNGAEALLGKGDMLFLQPGKEDLIRIQGALVKDAEIERVVEFIKAQSEPVYDDQILKEQQKNSLANGDKDELYDEAVRVIMESNQASVSILQRRMRLGYTRAARIIDMMEMEGLVGQFEGSKPRRILVDRDSWLKELTSGKEVEKT
ncbi:MAG: DNA translocase FtsK [Candidatus Omnitrophica bacterium]|nr:DNA translocase FtsK [Candidatus Omnitrophota bacterium]MBU4303478.1 DNA translocase FtsK [Candidatus Omnitrophota bacterium]MBU4419002.1 DNA translocase FtsK [Candidatus Omnitrophota bacterium]MBU4467461.1 DNA translocase FtsK [Candidatus Omnitrophota bacterium]MCG2708556.1 DNA translocase FtsK [Candidatus Omnitrophota bacterium]